MKKNGFSMIELTLVLIAIAILTSVVLFAIESLKRSAKLANAINMTANADFIDNDSLVLWLETSLLSKNKKNNESISSWKDNSKNKLDFTNTTKQPVIKDSKVFHGLKSIYFNGSNYLKSENPLNLSQYTAFLVIQPDSLTTSTTLFDSGFNAKINNLFDNQIIILKNDGGDKYIKRNAKASFEKMSSNSDNLSDSPSNFYIGSDSSGSNGYKGELLELLVFDKILSAKEILNVESYLNNKYMR